MIGCVTMEIANIHINVTNLNKRINSLKIGVNQLADLSGWTLTDIYRIKANGVCTKSQLADICNVLGCSKGYLRGIGNTCGTRSGYSDTYKERISHTCIKILGNELTIALKNSNLDISMLNEKCLLPKGYLSRIRSGGYLPLSSVGIFERIGGIKLVNNHTSVPNAKPTISITSYSNTPRQQEKTFVDEYLEQHTKEHRKLELEELISVNRHMVEVQNRIKEVNTHHDK